MAMKKLYIPDEWINKITFREPRRKVAFSTVDFSVEEGFETWTEAHERLIARRLKQFQSLAAQATLAERAYVRAQKMIPKGML